MMDCRCRVDPVAIRGYERTPNNSGAKSFNVAPIFKYFDAVSAARCRPDPRTVCRGDRPVAPTLPESFPLFDRNQLLLFKFPRTEVFELDATVVSCLRPRAELEHAGLGAPVGPPVQVSLETVARLR